ncbi:MAG: hypothetical protein RBT74_10635 [Tenuifilaceae bacterium]|jgi:hypothetical protein|nr:hypothetical protein [Tenuifilaceae bacterium]
MNKFIELHSNGFPVLVNLSNVVRIEPQDKMTIVFLVAPSRKEHAYLITVDERYEDVRQLVLADSQ